METYDGSATNPEVYSSVENGCSNGGDEMNNMDDEICELLPDLPFPPQGITDTSRHSSNSSEEYGMDIFCQLDSQNSVNSSQNIISAPHYSVYAHNSAFTAYIKSYPQPALHLSTAAHSLHRRCFQFLRKIEERNKLVRQMSRLTAPPPPPHPAGGNFQDRQKKTGFQNKSAFEHMVAERKRRVKLKEHFSNIYSLLPTNSKKDKHSILADATSYLRELKNRVDELEHDNQKLEELNFTDEGRSGFESHRQLFNSEGTILYRSDEVTLEQCKEIPCQVNIRISVQTDPILCPAAVLIKLMEQLKEEQLQVLSIHSHTEAFRFRAKIVVASKGDEWDTSKWQDFGTVVRECFVSDGDEFVVNEATFGWEDNHCNL